MRPGFLRHRKFLRLCRLTDSPRPLILGCVIMLWESAYESGDPFVGDVSDIESLAHWPGEPGVFAAALLDCGGNGHHGLIEEIDSSPGTYQIHDLFDHAPEYVAGRAARESERRKEKHCEHCGAIYHSPDKRSKYCSPACRTATWRDGVRQSVTSPLRSVTSRDGPPAPAPAPSPKDKKRAFAPPTLSEVKAFLEEKGYSVDPEKFHAYYESNGWMVGKNRMKDWHAACLTWHKNEKGYGRDQRSADPLQAEYEAKGNSPVWPDYVADVKAGRATPGSWAQWIEARQR